MCNLAGYTGTRQAAPVLLDMMRAQEGFGSGFYTGIATLHEGRIHSAKVVGDVDALVKNTDAANLPGTIGFAHGRPDMGGDHEWAHPFADNKARIAYAANGHAGFFDNPQNSQHTRNLLHQSGAEWRSRKGGDRSLAPGPDDTHGSEDKALLIGYFMDQGMTAHQALRTAFCRHPGELAALMLDQSRCDTLFAARISQPLMLAATEREMFVATTAMAFPQGGVEWIAPMPALSTAEITDTGISLKPLLPKPGDVADLFPWHEGETEMRALLAKQPGGCEVQDFKDATTHLWPTSSAPQKDHMVYEILRRWKAAGFIEFNCVRVASTCVDGLSGPRFRAVGRLAARRT